MLNYLGIDCAGWTNLSKNIGDRRVFDALGYVPTFIHKSSPLTIEKQVADNYQYFNGWREVDDNFNLDKDTMVYQYPGDPKSFPSAKFEHLGDTIYAYSYAFFIVKRADGSCVITRMD